MIMSRSLASKIAQRKAIKKIGVVGMGYVGIPAAMLFANAPQFDKVYRLPACISNIR